ncbi:MULTISPECIES: peptide-methionine (R)-S-oxide reductase MsrB [unclassified Rhizobium]|uniref:peptide-methionine (R)-S-oxide reductase MsrB n=1 Tax=unclassified Rhizobium TaxID=2613769 RepID=UPI001AD96F3C|nr:MULTISPECIES: peptide-methionine (R)-S-oxide reductase MsrB [unclassified Rhizobium]MBO9101137.1 peptide-methionine (R)-S-oxide reductase MsrB [Rhizobium sp. L58/93]MBO9168401.1 peptide-methionine (R)-S-oxide reductase MsrB [Rhizobium sp. L245/93]QXZ88202.1 peptide-methionine (R)-S-oxide reductase MsrB [Rhizobium sp. K1/93]QXZ94376.1 peptide-methionine (R)-S-oxide reductase MsrB [Rhizobium sp. K15/93]QYA05730.1 peptide-methionine (R)-S-oxide reductase MsrB [Rhizobium sp. B21/90]
MKLTRRLLLAGAGFGIMSVRFGLPSTPVMAATGTFPVSHTKEEWQKILTADQYAVLREEGTERPFTSELLHEERKGNFSCAGCDQDAFASTTKFDSGTGWPSFWQPIEKSVIETEDTSFGTVRTAVSCSRCGGHLGHVFNDGPQPTGLRYCMNGVAMKFHSEAA